MKILLIIFVLILWTETLADQSPAPGPEYADVVFLVDSSDHLGTKSFPFVKTFINKMINSLPIEADKYRVALAQYSDKLHSEFHLSTFKDRNSMLNHLKMNFQFIGGSLQIGKALQEAHRTYFSAPTNGRDRKQFPPILVVLASAESEDDVEEASKALQKDGVKIISVGVQEASEENLKAMATSHFHFNLRTVRDLSTFSQNMIQIIKDVTKYKEGAVDADIQVPFPISCQKDSLADLVFLVDESLGTRQNLRHLQAFLENITSSMDVKENCMRLGLMSYSNSAKTISFLKSSTTQSEFQQQIKKLSIQVGKSNAGAAIEQMRREGFSESHGSRRAQGVPQIAVLVTHRPSDDEVHDAALNLRLEDVTVFALSIQGANNTQLEGIVSYPPEQTISTLKSYADLETYSTKFLKKLQSEVWSQISTYAEERNLDKTGCMDTKEADIHFLIDGSTSIWEEQFEQIKKFMLEVTEMFSIGPDKVRVGVVQFSDKMREEFSITDYSNDIDLRKAILNIQQLTGDTHTGKALDFILPRIKNGMKDRMSQVPCYLIVLTDGKSQYSVVEPAKRVRAEKIIVHAIGIGEANKKELQEIAGKEERVSFGQNFDALKSIKNEVIRGICTEKGCEDMKADIMFLVDSSGSIGKENFGKMKIFMKNLLTEIQIGADKTQIGVVQFSDEPKEEFQLNTYFTQQEISDAIDRMSLIDKGTLMGKALNFVGQYFTHSKGARFGAKKFLILITDGVAQDDVRDPARILRGKDVTIFSVGVYGADRSQLEEISGDGSLVFYVENFDNLQALERKLVFRVCALHDCKRIKLLDVVFVLDHSGSIAEQSQDHMINLTTHLVKKADVGRDRVQFGALKYSDNPEILFYLNTYSNRSAIIENLRMRRDTGGNTYTAKALKHANALFTEEHGSRINQNVKQMLIVITDGESNDRAELNDTAAKLRDKGITIFAVGVGKADQKELEGMAGNKNNTIYVDNFDKLKDIYALVQESMCTEAPEVCNLQEADVIFLCDGSDRVSNSDFVTMTTFLSDLIDNFDIQSQRMKIGMAQFGSDYQNIIELKSSLNKTQWKTQIQTVSKSSGFPRIDYALKKVSNMFNLRAGGRRNAGVPQTLVVITSGDPRYNVAGAVKTLKDLGICVLVLGIGDVHKEQLLPITGNSEKIITFQDFDKLKNVDVKKRIVREICQSCGKTNCFMDIVIGFDISTHVQGQPLFQGHPQLESYLPGILEDITSIRGVSCGAGTEAQVSLAFKVNNDQEFPAKFQIYHKAMFDNLLQVNVSGPTHLNAQFLQSLWDTFKDKSTSRSQVLLIFSDGLQSESTVMLENQSDRLREAGLDALLVVSLSTAADHEFSSFEFGKGFDYGTHLTIGMRELGKTLSQYLGNIAERTCCCTFCKCPGIPGLHGARGLQAKKGSQGLKGNRGHRGEDGDPGIRGDIGPQGDKGITGCPGEQGQKGVKGFSGLKGEHGEDGIDGLDGEEGSHGLPGIKGEKGDPGSQGSPGSRGAPGQFGEKGFPGDPGNPGQNNNIKGQKGSKGEQGGQGRTGQKGVQGSPSSRGSRGREGQRGLQGASGEPGNPGPQGTLGAEGLQGPQGSQGNPGRKGEKGSQGHKGPQGSPGLTGAKGSIGRPGLLGKKGEPGLLGDPGPGGQDGQRGRQGDSGIPGYGQMGQKGVKGPRGFPGDVGQKGDIGDPGIPGGPGPKGFRGRTLSVGLKGEKGSRGLPGLPGQRGIKGMAGQPVYSQCDLIRFLRERSPCWTEKCPAYPTELVFALDNSYDITEESFNKTRDIIISIVSDLNIRENNCPVGARVAVVSYHSGTSYLIRWSDYNRKKQLLQQLSQIKYEDTTEPRDVGNAMRFVARNVFKRTYAGDNVRRVAVFFSNGQTAGRSSIITATMEFSALDISPTVFAFDESVFLEAFGFDNTGAFQVIPVPSNGESEALERLRHCTLCYDKCFPNACIQETFLPEDSYMDVAFLLDNSRNIANDEFKAVKALVSSVIDNFNIASDPSISNIGDRIALLSYSPWDSSRRNMSTVKTEFDFTTYNNQLLMKNHIQTSFQQLNGEATIGRALLWTTESLFPETPNLRKHKVIFVISAGENYEREEFVKMMALRAKCQGYIIFVVSLGSTHKDDMEELASYPLDQHLIQLGRIHKPDLNYIVKFLKPFVYSVRRGFNQYPPQMLEDACRLINLEREYNQSDGFQFVTELQEVFLEENGLTGQELNSGRESSFVKLKDNGSEYLVYLPSQMFEPQKLMFNYEKNQKSAEIASLTSGHENHGRKEEPDEPRDASFQEYYMDVAFLIDASQRVGSDEFKEVKAFITKVLDYFHIAPDPLTSTLGDRVAVLSYSPPGYMPNTEECPVYLEFDLVTYNSIHQMKHHLQDSQQLNGDVFIGDALQWTIDNVFVGTPNLRKNKVIFVISAGETNPSDKEVLRNVSLRAKSQGYSIFVFSFGPKHNDKELEELASHPLDHHLVQLGRTHKPDWDYIVNFVKPFVHLIRRAINKYPTKDMKATCVNMTSPNPENVGPENTILLIPEIYEIKTENGELFDDFDSKEQRFLVLENSHSNGSGKATDLMQKLYLLFSTQKLAVKDKEEAHLEETTAQVVDKQQEKEDGEDTRSS
ncbi:collagen alpha-5(VI) chain isoform X1 [Sapajus apella]|uniref:Collagen alpha-5(VI) chain n=1 Tax=Sapajus apella TaxID=9515 RepID=A0A6J3GYP7_SAPAP|nr:collagen alpha-5(VI) chain isoform X1 [Sapajus apella]XP_032122900.1 collagen alpha-5(VI) chain isoform X1 [Sapajus apella]